MKCKVRKREEAQAEKPREKKTEKRPAKASREEVEDAPLRRPASKLVHVKCTNTSTSTSKSSRRKGTDAEDDSDDDEDEDGSDEEEEEVKPKRVVKRKAARRKKQASSEDEDDEKEQDDEEDFDSSDDNNSDEEESEEEEERNKKKKSKRKVAKRKGVENEGPWVTLIFDLQDKRITPLDAKVSHRAGRRLGETLSSEEGKVVFPGTAKTTLGRINEHWKLEDDVGQALNWVDLRGVQGHEDTRYSSSSW